MTKRQQQAITTKKKILRCALDLFEEKGFDNVSMQEIAEKSQASIGAIYHYFSSKEEIAAQSLLVLDDIYHTFFEELTGPGPYQDLSALEKLEEYFLFVQRSCSQYNNLNILYIYNLKNPGDGTLAMSENRGLFRDYMSILKECRAEKSIRAELSDEEIVDFLVQSSRGILLDWLIRNKQFDFEAQLRRWWNLILSAIKS